MLSTGAFNALLKTLEEPKKIERVYSDEPKTGIFDSENVFLAQLSDDLLETSVTVAKLWQEEFSVSENQKTNDLIFVQFEKEGMEQFAFLRIALRETLTHLGGEVDNPIKLTQNNLPGFRKQENLEKYLDDLDLHLMNTQRNAQWIFYKIKKK